MIHPNVGRDESSPWLPIVGLATLPARITVDAGARGFGSPRARNAGQRTPLTSHGRMIFGATSAVVDGSRPIGGKVMDPTVSHRLGG